MTDTTPSQEERLAHQHIGPAGTVTCWAVHAETPHDLVPRPSQEERLAALVDAAQKMRAARERKAMAGPDLSEAIAAEQRLYQALDALALLDSDPSPAEPAPIDVDRLARAFATDDVPECDDGSHHVLSLARNVIEARPEDGDCPHCGQLAPCTERRIAVAFVSIMDAILRRVAYRR